MHLGDDVDTVDDERRVPRHAQRDVQHRPILGDVDVLAAEHRLGALAHAARVGERAEQRERLVGDAVLGVVEVPARDLDVEAIAAVRVVGEDRPQVPRADAPRRGRSAPATRAGR